jgi:anti-anti-sigma factor
VAAGAEFGVDVRNDEGSIVVALTGELDLHTARRLDDALSALDRNGRPLILDCDQLVFCDSSGLAAMMKHRPLSLRSPQESLRRLLEITALTDFIESAAREEDLPEGRPSR